MFKPKPTWAEYQGNVQKLADTERRLRSAESSRDAWKDSFKHVEKLYDRNILFMSRKLAIAERAAHEAIDANQEFAAEALKAQTEILELKADIAEQVRVNRQYASEVGTFKKSRDEWQAEATRLHLKLNSSYGKPLEHKHFVFDNNRDNLEKALFEPTAEDHLKTIAKRDKTIKRLKAKVKKLMSDNKAMAAEVLHNRNSM